MRLFSEIDVWLIIIITAYWVFLISDISAGIVLAIIVGLTSGLVYRFIVKKEEKTIKLTRISIFSPEKLLIASFITLLFTFLTSSINSIYLEDWLAIPATNWIRFMVVGAFCAFIPGFILIKLVDRENKLPTRVNIILSVLLSIFFTSLFWYTIKMAALDSDLVNILFITANFTLILIYLQHTRKKAKPDKTDSLRMLNLDGAMALGILVILSVILVYVQQSIYKRR